MATHDPARLALASAILAAASIPAVYFLQRSCKARSNRNVPPTEERVLVLGASSGVGRAVAKQYAARGAKVCVVARRPEQMFAVVTECGDRCMGVTADMSIVEDMVRVRERILHHWDGLDTLHICAGVSALQPVMALTGTESAEVDANTAGIQNAVDIARRATQGNFVGPFVAAVAFIPLLTRTSLSPSILLVSSVAAIVPAPTRALYAATKASSLLLFQSLAIEHPNIVFAFMLPATIEGNFRASAVDAGPVREADPNKQGLKTAYVAERCIDAVDRQVRGSVVLPWWPYAFARHLYYLVPSIVERGAAKKYNFSA